MKFLYVLAWFVSTGTVAWATMLRAGGEPNEFRVICLYLTAIWLAVIMVLYSKIARDD